MALQQIANLTERTDDTGEPFVVIQEVNDELEGTPYSIHCAPTSNGYGYVLTMEEE